MCHELRNPLHVLKTSVEFLSPKASSSSAGSAKEDDSTRPLLGSGGGLFGNDEVVDEQMAILEDVTEAIDRMEVGSLGGNYVCFCMCVCGGGGTPLSTRPFAASIPPPQPSTRAVLAAVNGVIFVCTT